jgi:lipopolysaccharide export system protein LptA
MKRKRQTMRRSSALAGAVLLAAILLQPATPLRGEDQTFTFSGDSTSILMKEGQRRTVLEGSARVRSESTAITAERIELYGEDFRYARCNGAVEVRDSERGISLTAESILFDRERNYLRVDGYSEMVDFENEVVAKSSYLENYGDERKTVFQIGVRILKSSEDSRMVCRSEYARYDRNEDLLLLSGTPVVHWKNDVYRASRIRIDLDTEEITMEGNVEGTITAEPEEENGGGEQQ